MPITKNRIKSGLETIVPILTVLVIWQLLAVVGVFDQRILPSPLGVADGLIESVYQPFAGSTLLGHAGSSVVRLAVGFGLAAIIAIPLGVIMGRIKTIDAVVAPYFEVLRFIPPIAWVPFSILWLGIGLAGQTLVIFIGAFPAILINTHQATRDTPKVLIDAARTLGSNEFQTVREVVLPSTVPLTIAGLRIGLSVGWMSLVGAELIAATSGLGFLIMRAQSALNSELIIAGMITIGVLGLVMDLGIKIIERRLLKWRS